MTNCKRVIHDWIVFEQTLLIDDPLTIGVIWECQRCGQQRKTYEKTEQ